MATAAQQLLDMSTDFKDLFSQEGPPIIEQPVQAAQTGFSVAVVSATTEQVSHEGCIRLCIMLKRVSRDSGFCVKTCREPLDLFQIKGCRGV